MLNNTQPYYHKRLNGNIDEKNNFIFQQFLKHYQEKDINRTHYFNGRYENIYLNEQHIPELQPLMQQANEFAINILGNDSVNENKIRQGYWFNFMPPASTTTLHTHDDDDELLSCVYYVHVPKNSGNLIIHSDKKIEIQPQSGDFIFFKPNMPHEVSKNNSTEYRLSIGINFGRT